MAKPRSSTIPATAAEVVDRIGAEPAHLLSDYEQWRARNIERNNAKLRQLGLIGQEEERLSNDLAWGRCPRPTLREVKRKRNDDGVSSQFKEKYVEEEKEWPRKAKKSLQLPREGCRKSLRLANQPASGEDASNGNDYYNNTNEGFLSTKERRAALVAECREARQRAAIEVAKAGLKMAAKENPTASYEHCLMRVKSMTEKALAARVRKIESAAGKHCVVKMAIFKSCLQDENMWELAKVASDSLERLKALLPPPQSSSSD